jgi:predicted transcriptional regulator
LHNKDVDEAEQIEVLEEKITNLEKTLEEMEKLSVKNTKRFKKLMEALMSRGALKSGDSSPVKSRMSTQNKPITKQ